MERTNNVFAFLEQNGNILQTSILAPGATGTSNQLAPHATTEGQAENRQSRGAIPAKQRYRRYVVNSQCDRSDGRGCLRMPGPNGVDPGNVFLPIHLVGQKRQ